MNDNAKVRFYIDKTGFFAESAMILFLLSAIFRFIGCWGLWNDRVNFIMVFLLPLCCCVLMTLAILLFGKKGFFLSFIPVLLGVVFFVYQALSYDSWVHTVLCILLYLVIALVYTATVFVWIRTNWLLPALPLPYHHGGYPRPQQHGRACDLCGRYAGDERAVHHGGDVLRQHGPGQEVQDSRRFRRCRRFRGGACARPACFRPARSACPARARRGARPGSAAR